MTLRSTPIALAIAVLAAAGFAAFRSVGATPEPAEAPVAGPPMPVMTAAPEPSLPPNHPPINGAAAHVVPASEDAAIAWKAPASLESAPSPSAMRLATYRAGHDTEIAVSRAGGGTDANIERWLGQFDGAGREKRLVETVHGLTVTVVEVSGTYLGGGMGGTPAAQHPDWTLVGAIVETKGSSYFFKMVGPAAAVRAARPAFDQLIGSIDPA